MPFMLIDFIEFNFSLKKLRHRQRRKIASADDINKKKLKLRVFTPPRLLFTTYLIA